MDGPFVPGRGPLDAEIVVVGEAPGRREVEALAPFVGPSGKLQEAWIRAAGLEPWRIRYENVYPWMPQGGEIGTVPWGELQLWMEDLRARMDDLARVKVIVPTGNVAVSCFLPGGTPATAKITQRRGSLYLWDQSNGRKVKVIPVIHPAAVLREEGERSQEGGQVQKKNYESRCRADWRKVAGELECDLPVPPRRDLWTSPEPDSILCQTMLHATRGGQMPLAFDIETDPSKGRILCISFALEGACSVSVPWSKKWMTWIKSMLNSPAPKITQNGHYDCYWLAWEGAEVANWQWDTMAMHCLLEPGEPHSLAYLASVYTREPWYKGGDEDTGEKAWASQKWEELLEYNARDAAVTWEVFAALQQELDTRGWMETYQEEYQALFQPMLRVMLHGVRVERGELDGAFNVALSQARQALDQAQSAAGRPLFVYDTQVQEACWRVSIGEWERDDPEVAKKLTRAKGGEEQYVAQVEAKGISTRILGEVLYQGMKLPTQRKRRTRAVTTDEAALLKLRARFKDGGKYPQAMALIEQALAYREHKKQSEFLDPGRVDKDGRFRTSYSFRPTTGRLSSSSNPRGTGGNAQNIDRALRDPFKPDPGCLLLEVDLSQAEARVVYCLTENKHLIEMAHSRPSQFDVHSFMAREVLGFGPWDLSTEEGKKQKADDRYTSKRVAHATHYDMHELKGSEICLKDGHNISPKRFGALQRKYKDFAEGLEAWQQRTRMEGLRERALTNAWGRTIRYPYDKPGDDWYRKLYAWRPQSDIARHLNRAWVRLDQWLERQGMLSKVNLQLHDALIVSCLPEESWEVMGMLVDLCEEPHDYYGERLCIPAEVKVGLAWGQGVGFKERPEREAWEATVAALIEESTSQDRTY